MGNSRITLELRPLAFSMLAELVHHVRSELSLPQLSRIIYLFCRLVCCPQHGLTDQPSCVHEQGDPEKPRQGLEAS